MPKYWKARLGSCIYQTPSGLAVHQNLLYRWLTLGNETIQSMIHRQHPERPVLRYIPHLTLLARHSSTDCCLLGLGGASVAHTLHATFKQAKATLDAVENSPDVIQVAADYFKTASLDSLHIIQQDAFDFTRLCQKRYLHIMVDLFTENNFPMHCSQDNFFRQCKNLLLIGGTLAINVAQAEDLTRIHYYLVKHFHRNTLLLPVRGTANTVILAYNAESVLPLIQQVKLLGMPRQIVWDPKWGYIAWV